LKKDLATYFLVVTTATWLLTCMSSNNVDNEKKTNIAQGVLWGFAMNIPPLIGSFSHEETRKIFSRMQEDSSKPFYLIPDNLCVRSVTKRDIEICKPRLGSSIPYAPKLGQYVVEWKYDDPNELTRYNLVWKTYLAFLLLKQGFLVMPYIYSFKEDAKHWGLAMPIASFQIDLWRMGRYDFSLIEKKAVLHIFHNLRSIDFEKRATLRIACDRFLRLNQEFYFEDRLIDVFIGFEALLEIGLDIKKKGEEIADRCYELISDFVPDGEKVEGNIKQAYKLRNKIVHGDPFRFEDVNRHAQILEDYLRKSILTVTAPMRKS
jgi:hypothetical protein